MRGGVPGLRVWYPRPCFCGIRATFGRVGFPDGMCVRAPFCLSGSKCKGNLETARDRWRFRHIGCNRWLWGQRTTADVDRAAVPVFFGRKRMREFDQAGPRFPVTPLQPVPGERSVLRRAPLILLVPRAIMTRSSLHPSPWAVGGLHVFALMLMVMPALDLITTVLPARAGNAITGTHGFPVRM